MDYKATWRDRMAAHICNFVLRHLATEQYQAFVAGSVEYGLRAAARDEAEGRKPPPGGLSMRTPLDGPVGMA